MSNETYQILMQVSTVIVAVFGGGVLVPVIGKIKEVLKLDGYASVALMTVVSALFAVAELFVAGKISPDITAANFGSLVVAVIAGSQVVYRMLKDAETKRAIESAQ